MDLVFNNLSFKQIYSSLYKKSNGTPYFKFGFTFNSTIGKGFIKHYPIQNGLEIIILDGVFFEDIAFSIKNNNRQTDYLLQAAHHTGVTYESNREVIDLSEDILFHKPIKYTIQIAKNIKIQTVFVKLSQNFLEDFPEKEWIHIQRLFEMHAPEAIIKQNYKIKKYLKRLFLAQEFHYGVKPVTIINTYKLTSEFFFSLYNSTEEQKFHNKSTLSINDILDLNNAYHQMIKNTYKPLTLTEISSLYNMSTSKFRKIFKYYYGDSYKATVIKLKMEKAKELVLQGYNVNEVANILNYSQASKLSQIFKKYHNVLPSKRKKLKTIQSITPKNNHIKISNNTFLMNKIFTLFLYSLFFLSNILLAQEFKYKINVSKNLHEQNRWTINLDGKLEDIINRGWTRISTKGNASYYISPNLDALGGLDLKYLFDKDYDNIFELRPFLGLSYHAFLMKNIDIKQRLLLESRNLFTDSNGNKNTFRTRFKVELDYLLSETEDRRIKIPFFLEWFIQENDEINDRFVSNNSISLGISRYDIKKRTQWKLEYIIHKTRNPFDEVPDDEYVHEIGLNYQF